MSIGPTTSLREMAFIVGTALHEAGIAAVLSGGGAATVYAPEAIQSHDLDFILAYWSSMGVSARPLLDLGFLPKGGSYAHPGSSITLEFPQGPLSIGSDLITYWDTLEEHGRVLNILSPTDCVRDRLCWFPFYGNIDYSALEQALAVAVHYEIDTERIRRWCEVEGVMERYAIFESRYRAMKGG